MKCVEQQRLQLKRYYSQVHLLHAESREEIAINSGQMLDILRDLQRHCLSQLLGQEAGAIEAS